MRSILPFCSLTHEDIKWRDQCEMLVHHTSRVEVREYDWKTAPLDMVRAAIWYGFYPNK